MLKSVARELATEIVLILLSLALIDRAA